MIIVMLNHMITENDTYICYPTKNDVVTKLAFAVEGIYLYNQKK